MKGAGKDSGCLSGLLWLSHGIVSHIHNSSADAQVYAIALVLFWYQAPDLNHGVSHSTRSFQRKLHVPMQDRCSSLYSLHPSRRLAQQFHIQAACRASQFLELCRAMNCYSMETASQRHGEVQTWADHVAGVRELQKYLTITLGPSIRLKSLQLGVSTTSCLLEIFVENWGSISLSAVNVRPAR